MLRQNVGQASELAAQKDNNQTEMQDMARKIKHYQDDNLRLSNEVVQLSNKLENSKNRLKNFENNKSRLMSQLENLNNIISENNVIDNSFGITAPKVEQKVVPEVEQKIEKEQKITEEKSVLIDQFKPITKPKKIKNFEELNRLTKEIFNK